jgi:mannan endo-1,4-beta-mannosidase
MERHFSNRVRTLVATLFALGALLTCIAAIGSQSPAAASSHPSDFVSRAGTTLRLDGKPYRFKGINIYMAASGGTPSSCGGELYPNLSAPLSHLPEGIVIRFWAFQDFFVSNGHFDWKDLDAVIWIAALHHDKVIPVLANQYSYCDGPSKTLPWYDDGYERTVEPGDIVPYRQFVSDVVHRYSDNSTIAMWQLVNEGEAVNANGSCNEREAHQALLAFSNDIGGLIHRTDRHHLVSLGTLQGWAGSGRGQWCGAANSDYRTLMASPGNDVCDYHDYGYSSRPMGTTSRLDLRDAIVMCHSDDKPIMVAETGIYAESPNQVERRASEFRSKFSAQFKAGVVGELMWEWVNKPAFRVPVAGSDYGIFPDDPALSLLRSR